MNNERQNWTSVIKPVTGWFDIHLAELWRYRDLIMLFVRRDFGYRHLHIKEKGKIIYFRVQYETKINDKWHAVVRYDTAHGFAHRDLMDIRGRVDKTPLFNQDYNDALTFAEHDLKTNWELYKKRFSEEKDE